MIVIIVDDDDTDANRLAGYLDRFSAETGEKISVRRFKDGMDLVSDYVPDCDVIFLDIEMRYLDGMEAAKKVRRMDDAVALVFVTNMAQYAVKGYEVDATDFLVKPVEYGVFAEKLRRALRRVRRRPRRQLLVSDEESGSVVRIFAADVLYVEKEKNYTVYHTVAGVYRKREQLSDAAEELGGGTFSRINSGSIVNMSHIDKVTQTTVTVGGDELPLARRRKKDFLGEYMRYLGGKGGTD